MAEIVIEENSAVLTNVVEHAAKQHPSYPSLIKNCLNITGFGLYDDNTPANADYSNLKDFGTLVGWCDAHIDNSDQSHPINGNRVLSQFESEALPDGSIRTRIVGEFGTETAAGNINKVRIFGQIANPNSTETPYQLRAGLDPKTQEYAPLINAFTHIDPFKDMGYLGIFTNPLYFGGYGGMANFTTFTGILGDGRVYSLKLYDYQYSKNTALTIFPLTESIKLSSTFIDGVDVSSSRVGTSERIDIPLKLTRATYLRYDNWKYYRTSGSLKNNNIYQFEATAGSNQLNLVVYEEASNYAPTETVITLDQALLNERVYCVTPKMDGSFDILYVPDAVAPHTRFLKQNYNPTTQALSSSEPLDIGMEIYASEYMCLRHYIEDPVTGLKYVASAYMRASGSNSSSRTDNHSSSLTVLGLAKKEGEIGVYTPFYAGQQCAGSTKYNWNHSTAVPVLARALYGHDGFRCNYITTHEAMVTERSSSNDIRPVFFSAISPKTGDLLYIAGDLYGGGDDDCNINRNATSKFTPMLPSCVIAEAQVTEVVKTNTDQLRVILDLVLKVAS